MKTCWADVETTGLSSYKNEIWQLAVIIDIDGKVVEEKNYKMRPLKLDTVQPKALAVGNVTLEQIKEFPHPSEAFRDLMATLQKYVDRYNRNDKFFLAGQNVEFDKGFLRQFFKNNGETYFGSYFHAGTIDLMTATAMALRAGRLQVADFKLGTVCAALGIDLKAHDALEDIKATREAFETLSKMIIKERPQVATLPSK